MSNSSSITQFLLLALTGTRELQLLHFWLFLGICLAALLGNGLIIMAIACDYHLHTPMYFFLLNLSLIDLYFISTTVPKAMANSLWDTRDISYLGCCAQVFQFVFFISAEFYLLTLMAYDRYVAICKPLHYGTLLETANTFSLPLCQGNALDQFFCEVSQILKLSCSDTYLREVGLLVVSVSLIHLLPSLDLTLAVLYSVVPPAVNPLIYSMRNQDLKDAMWKLITGFFSDKLNCLFSCSYHL
ncbi:PREDICTED: olfactory receptor 14A16-like [Chlamydotis macqueenii]|uniref:olfactory receptor 14A16-like n=1 Tax=Chlamydotis macqueenii TaxID=187382 RepID=UPI000529E2C7|nr:PREDICTED: olfactory receptor 14A16-like [Chlamydotis macqueenii]